MKNTQKPSPVSNQIRKAKKIASIILAIIGFIYFLPNDYPAPYGGVMFMSIAFLVSNSFDEICKEANVKPSLSKRIFYGILIFIVPLAISVFLGIDDLESTGFLIITIFSDLVLLGMATSNSNKRKKPTKISSNNDEQKNLETSIKAEDITKQVTTERENDKMRIKQQEIERSEELAASAILEMDTFSLTAIARLLSDYNSIWGDKKYLPKIDMAILISEINEDSLNIKSEEQLAELFNADYFKEKYAKHFKPLKKFFRSQYRKAQVDSAINKMQLNDVYESIAKEYRQKLIAYYYNMDKEARNTWARKTEDSQEYMNGINFVHDTLCTVASIGLLLFINRKADSLKKDSDLRKTIVSAYSSIPDFKVVIESIFPVYFKFYYNELMIKSPQAFQIAVSIASHKEEDSNFLDNYKNILLLDKYEKQTIEEKTKFDKTITDWLDKVSDSYRETIDVSRIIVAKIKKLIKNKNLKMLLYGLERMKTYSNIYEEMVFDKNRLEDKERYLRGDFSKELSNIGERLNLNNISSGTQFEHHLEGLLRRFGYEVKHLGKSGDQGADLLAKYKKQTYAIQAKYYTGSLSNTPVQEVIGSLKFYSANQGVVITNSIFTKGARDLAKANNVILIDGKKLKEITELVFERPHGDIIKTMEEE